MEILNQILNEVGEDVINVYRRKLYENNVNATGSLSSTLSCFVQVEKDTYDLYIRIQDY